MTKKQRNLIVVDDNPGVLAALQLLLTPYFNKVELLPSPNRLPAALSQGEWHAVLLDMNFHAGVNNGNEGLYWLHEIKRMQPTLPVVLFTAFADIDLAVRGIKEGATDFVVKPWDNARLTDTLRKAAEGAPTPAGTAADTPAPETPIYWGTSEAMQRLRDTVEKVAHTDANVLITGENGTGKEVLARELHRLSPRHLRPMVSVDMGAVSETLFESELFGHVKGAFTDAVSDREGKFEAANHSTLFLDEIGNLPYHLQAKLLAVLQQRTVTRIGSNTPLPIDIRLVCATNRRPDEMVTQGRFREDLLYRINTIHLEIPPLRQRPMDIVPLAEHFIDRFAQHYGRSVHGLSGAAADTLRRHTWPGNIRELEHAIEKAVIISDEPLLKAEHFSLRTRAATPSTESASTLEEMEVQMIHHAIEQCAGNLSAVAARLGITRQTLYNKMKKYGI